MALWLVMGKKWSTAFPARRPLKGHDDGTARHLLSSYLKPCIDGLLIYSAVFRLWDLPVEWFALIPIQ